MNVKERTLAIIKPNGMKKNIVGEIIRRAESGGLRVVAAEMKLLTRDEARLFYLEHAKRSFYDELVAFMCSAPVMVMVFEGENAVVVWRAIMGHTDPAKADPGTIRRDFGDSVGENVVHGSDSPTSAAREVAFFFDQIA